MLETELQRVAVGLDICSVHRDEHRRAGFLVIAGSLMAGDAFTECHDACLLPAILVLASSCPLLQL